jgi:integrase
VSGQARAELRSATFKSVHDGYWWVERGKTQARVAIPLSLRLDVLGKSLEDVIRQCRQTGVVSPYLIHHTEHAGLAKPGQRVTLKLLSCRFAEVLAGLNLDFEDKEPPTLHEIRSLAARFYKAQGNVSRKDLLAHTDQKTTKIYEDPRGEWLMVSASDVATV